MGARGAGKREVRAKIARSVASNCNSITVIVDWKGGSGGTLTSLYSLASDSHNLLLQQHWGVSTEADGYSHGWDH